MNANPYNNVMARHSHWHQIRLKKGAADQKRGKIFTRHARLIEMAARRSGGDESMNPALAAAIENARSDNMPRENIERAVKKALGAGKDAAAYEELTYEGFGPGGSAYMIETLTDNKNRTNQTVRSILQSKGGSLGAFGATSFLFERKGELLVAPQGPRDEDELKIIDAGAEEIEETPEGFVVYCAIHDAGLLKKNLIGKGFQVTSFKLTYVPKNTVLIDDQKIVQKNLELVDALEQEDDVTNVSANFEIPA